MKQKALLGIMLISSVLIIGGMVWHERSIGENTAKLIVGVSGNTQGYLEPCDCQVERAGGLARRQTLLQQNTVGLLIDTGSVFGGTGTYERLKGAYLLHGMKQMGYAAVNLGETELALPPNAVSHAIQQSGIRFVSCNVTADNKNAVPLSRFLIERRGNLRIGITGIAETAGTKADKGWTIKPSLEALSAALPILRTQCDVLIVLASTPSETLTTIAEHFPEIDALCGSTPDGTAGNSRVNRTTLFTTGSEGKTLGRLTFQRQAERFTVTDTQTVKIPYTITPDPQIATLITDFQSELRTRRITPAKTEGMERIESPPQHPTR